MLRPQDTATRERKSLDGLWQFALDPDDAGRTQRWFDGRLPASRQMAVPASFNDIAADAAVRDYLGDVWYQTTVRVPRGWDGRRIVVHFESATHRATVWVNGVEVVSHEGGYTPFEADVTELVTPGEEARITAVVNNTLSFQTIPPGVIEDTPDGKRQAYWHDFFNYAGSTVTCGCTAPAGLTSPTSRSSPASMGPTGRSSTAPKPLTPTALRFGSCCATPRARRWRQVRARAAR
jgi:beta-glucuronidase